MTHRIQTYKAEKLTLEALAAKLGTFIDVRQGGDGGWRAEFHHTVRSVSVFETVTFYHKVSGRGADPKAALVRLARDVSGQVVVCDGLYEPRPWWRRRKLREIDLRFTQVMA